MREQLRGFSLIEVVVAVVLLAMAVSGFIRAVVEGTGAVATGRRWSAMAIAADSEVGRLARDYRATSPICLVPPPGSRVTPDGVGVDWAVAGDSVHLAVTVEARALVSRRALIDTISTVIRCQ